MTKESVMRYTDLSTMDSFQFLFHCDRCGFGVLSERYAFCAEGFDQPIIGPVRTLLWTRQHDEAYARARNEAQLEYNLCPDCGRRVCTECFHVSSEAITDLCVDCKKFIRKPSRHKSFALSQRV